MPITSAATVERVRIAAKLTKAIVNRIVGSPPMNPAQCACASPPAVIPSGSGLPATTFLQPLHHHPDEAAATKAA
jgi:hypothetical protein